MRVGEVQFIADAKILISRLFNYPRPMLDKKSVLILGAGASAGYGYPTGPNLRQEIIKLLGSQGSELKYTRMDPRNPKVKLSNGDEEIAFLIRNCGFAFKQLEDFYNDLLRSPRTSIDSFLQFQPKHLKLGKTLIALTILRRESASELWKFERQADWYGHLFNVLAPTWEAFQENSLDVITYNYDRSFEFYFLEGLQRTFDKSYQEAVNAFLKVFRFTHVHGQVGRKIEEYSTVPYGSAFTPEYIAAAAEELSIVWEDQRIVHNYGVVRAALADAEQVFILGFGFDKTNMERLQLKNCKAPIFATCIGMHESEIFEAGKLANIYFGGKEKTKNILDFFQEVVSLTGYTNRMSLFGPEEKKLDVK